MAQGHTLATITRDRAPGGPEALDRRAGLHQAVALVADRRAAGLVVTRLAVLASNPVLQEVILVLVRDHHGEVFTCDRGRLGHGDPLDPSRTTVREALLTFARLERQVRGARSSARRQRKVARGDYAGG